MTLPQHLIERNRGRKARLAFVDDHGRLSYGELHDRIRRCAAGQIQRFRLREAARR
ncbi:MAG: hypothetical protein AB7G13_29110 [Lautropia sp.]